MPTEPLARSRAVGRCEITIEVDDTRPSATSSWTFEDAGHLARVRFLIRDRDAKYPTSIDKILGSAGIATVLTGVRMPRMNSIIERWVMTLRAELLDRTLI